MNEVSYDTLVALLVMQYGNKLGKNWTARITDEVIVNYKEGSGDLSLILDRDEEQEAVTITVGVAAKSE